LNIEKNNKTYSIHPNINTVDKTFKASLDNIKLAVFDFDSTLIDGETIDFLAKEMGVEDMVCKITQKAMNGELDFFESLIERVGLLRGMKKDKAREVCENMPLMRGAKICIKELKKRSIIVVCFSGGFSLATNYFSKILGIDADFSNVLHIHNNILSGRVGGEMMFNDSKGLMLRRLQSILHISSKETMAIGDGANDKSMFLCSNLKIAFCAKEVLKECANIIIEKNSSKQKDLTEILHYFNI